MSALEKKIYVMADEVLDILKQLSQDNKSQLNSKVIAERMFIRDTVKKMLAEPGQEISRSPKESSFLKEIADTFLDRFSELAPHSISSQFRDLQGSTNELTFLEDTTDWLDSTVKIIRRYYDSLSIRNKELEEFILQTMSYLAETESHLKNELSTHQDKFSEDRKFENSLSSSMDMIANDLDKGTDIRDIKAAVLGKIDSINNGIEQKRKQDVERLRKTEKNLEEMNSRINDIKKEADEIKKKAEEIESESLHDSLTGLLNRKAYEQKIIETFADLNRYGVTSSLLVCDVDNFKKINDTFGHKVGDLALKKLASLISEKLRVNDFLSRYGGEEFAIILPHTDLPGAARAGQGIVSYINQAVFSYKDNIIPLTISIGISLFNKSDDPGTVFERADSALYLAKQSGKNTVKTENDLVTNDGPLSQHSILT